MKKKNKEGIGITQDSSRETVEPKSKAVTRRDAIKRITASVTLMGITVLRPQDGMSVDYLTRSIDIAGSDCKYISINNKTDKWVDYYDTYMGVYVREYTSWYSSCDYYSCAPSPTYYSCYNSCNNYYSCSYSSDCYNSLGYMSCFDNYYSCGYSSECYNSCYNSSA